MAYTRRDQARDMLLMTRAISTEIDELSFDGRPENITQSSSRADGTVVLRTKQGKLVAHVADEPMAKFVKLAVQRFQSLVKYVRQLEAEAYASRFERRLFKRARVELDNAFRVGLQTRAGQDFVRKAIEILDSDPEDTPW